LGAGMTLLAEKTSQELTSIRRMNRCNCGRVDAEGAL
jgi:hypothetical protein